MGNHVVHVEVAGRDGHALMGFYSQLFGWTIEHREAGGEHYGFVKEGDAGAIGTGIRHEPEGSPEVVFYVSVSDLGAAVKKAQKLGGGVRIPPMSAGDLHFALVTDPEGNPVGMIQTK